MALAWLGDDGVVDRRWCEVRTNIDIDDGLMERAMQAGPYKTKKDAVEAGLKLLVRHAAYRAMLK